MDFSDAVQRLALAQAEVGELETEFSDALTKIKVAKNAAKIVEEELRQGALESFLSTGDKSPHEAVSIRNVVNKDYDTEGNVREALARAPQVLEVDEAKFEAAVQSMSRLIAELDEAIEQRVMPVQAIHAQLIRDCFLDMLTVNNTLMRGYAKNNDVTWAEVIETVKPTVYVEGNLTGYISTEI